MDSERRETARLLKAYLQLQNEKSPAAIQRYADRILSGEADAFTHLAAQALQTQSQSTLRDLLGEESASRKGRSLDLQTLLFMQDADDRMRTAKSRPGTRRVAKDSDSVLSVLDGLSKSQNGDRFVALTEPYLPCITRLDSLEIVKLTQLTMETHHCGRAILVERIGPLIPCGILTLGAVKDLDGEVEDMELYHADSHLPEALPLGMLFAIKEPYFTVNLEGVPTIRVDHPTDLVPPDRLPSCFVLALLKQIPPRMALDWKNAGNELYRSRRYIEAAQAYQFAVDSGAEGGVRLDVCRNLASVGLVLGRYEEARLHAIHALSGRSDPASAALDVKAYYRAARASYHLRDFVRAERELTSLLALDPRDDDGVGLMEKVRVRLIEAANGTYDLDKLVRRFSRQQPHVDIADFTERTVIGASHGRGRGLFAAEDVQLGEVVLCKKAFLAVFHWESETESPAVYDVRRQKFAGFPGALWTRAVQKVQQTPSRCAEFTSLSGGHTGLGRSDTTVDGSPVIDAFQIHDIIAANAFAIPTPSKAQKTEPFGLMKVVLPTGTEPSTKLYNPRDCALFGHASLANHSCLPNVTRVFLGDAIVLRAMRPIAKGEEILHTYVTGHENVQERQDKMQLIWGFRCSCRLCKTEQSESEDLRRRRATLVEEADRLSDDILSDRPDSAHRGEAVRLAEGLHARLKASLNVGAYQFVPRIGMSSIQVALARVYLLRQEHGRCRAILIDAFDCLGWTLVLRRGASALLSPKAGYDAVVVEQMVPLLATAYRLLRATGEDLNLAELVRSLARRVYVTLNGVENGIEQVDGVLGRCAKGMGL
ncbi:hypothetical protein LTR53_007873 [Teratosphaeriaceae sp. CCFEE 6253]|nr:hypothetical protein LTR53_007873 [Teratosphaeriaceae sp. CCFEE 6253]